MTERRYDDSEIRKILELATRPEAVGPHPETGADGLTLLDIQSIALEVGIAPEAVSRAATTLDVSATPARKSWGMPIEVARTVPLRRALTDHEWDQLVAELRATFRARGRVMVQGGLREWANGNLHACVEPTDDGYRLRLGTIKGNAAGRGRNGYTLLHPNVAPEQAPASCFICAPLKSAGAAFFPPSLRQSWNIEKDG
ncbi:hypothetical protein BH23GEM5_BH23GEM5_23600 [soil metagenome]